MKRSSPEDWEIIVKMLEKFSRNIPLSQLPNRILTVPHLVLNKVPFFVVPVTAKINGWTGDGKRLLGDVFRGGIWMVPSISIAIRIDRKTARREIVNLNDFKLVSATCPSVALLDQKKSDNEGCNWGKNEQLCSHR